MYIYIQERNKKHPFFTKYIYILKKNKKVLNEKKMFFSSWFIWFEDKSVTFNNAKMKNSNSFVTDLKQRFSVRLVKT